MSKYAHHSAADSATPKTAAGDEARAELHARDPGAD